MKLDAEKVKVSECLTMGEYVKLLKERTGNENISGSTVHYHLTEKGETLDYIDWCGLKLIVQNAKALAFTPGGNYGRVRTEKKMKF